MLLTGRTSSHARSDSSWEWLSGVAPNTSSSKASAFLGQAMFAYQVFDLLLWVFDWPGQLKLLSVPRSPAPADLPASLRKVLFSVGSWPDLLSKARESWEIVATKSKSRRTVQPKPTPNHSGVQAVQIALGNLGHALNRGKKAIGYRILSAVHSIAFVIAWASVVSLSFAHLLISQLCLRMSIALFISRFDQ
jgi:hypothetical protein